MSEPSGKSQYKQLLSRLGVAAFARVAEAVDRTVGWDKLPLPLGIATLIGIRERLRKQNLYDAHTPAAKLQPVPPPEVPRYRTARTVDGTYNDLENRRMGSACTRFGRNVPMIGRTFPDPDIERDTVGEPDPRKVSLELLTRKRFLPVRGLNLLAAAWVQFMIRDWFNHGKGTMENAWKLELREDDPWRGERPMRIPRTPKDPTRTPEEGVLPPTYVNEATHWWDGSQIYGNNKATQDGARSGQRGELKIGPDGLIPVDPRNDPAKEPGIWVGMAMMHMLFTREHNAICKRLREEYPNWSDDALFDHARLINAALMAKIHTVEWTPAILGHPTVQLSLRSNWWGLAGERIHKLFGRISANEMISGIPGSSKDHFGVPYSMTEEFVGVYRMHPLIPDEYTFRSATNDVLLQERTLRQIAGENVLEVLKQISMTDLLYSFGIAHPGEITLHNYPHFLQEFERPDGILVDLAATDILRTRELGLPRYNEFRELLHRPRVRTFEELTDNPVWAEEISRVYDNDIDQVDLMVGLFAEPRPAGFGFSDTAFRVFILMASRRLNSDRFFTTDYTPEVYTQAGLDWIDDNDMSTVLLRHFPDLWPSLRNVKNAFFPWRRV